MRRSFAVTAATTVEVPEGMRGEVRALLTSGTYDVRYRATLTVHAGEKRLRYPIEGLLSGASTAGGSTDVRYYRP